MTVFQEVVDQLDLEAAVATGSQRNDLLPPRHEDKVGGELGRRFSDALRSRLERGRYEPVPAEIIRVRKPGNTTRPAALLTLADRVVYAALVDAFRRRIDIALLGDEIVFWPRGLPTDKRWTDFEQAPIGSGAEYVASADVSAFYESVDHELLHDSLVEATGRRRLVDALVEFLGRIMKKRRGIPQGPEASDPIASAFLSPVDQALARSYPRYYRHGDDFRIATDRYSQAKRALFDLETQLREWDLVLSSPKARVLSMPVYQSARERGEEVAAETRRLLLDRRVRELEEDPGAVVDLLEEAGEEEIGWDFFYHGNINLQDLIVELEEHLEPDDVEVAARMFRDAMERRPGTADELEPEEFHHRVTSALVRLAAAKSPEALPDLPPLLSDHPDKTEVVANYLLALGDDHADEALEIAFGPIEDAGFHTEWETSWLLFVILKYADHVTPAQEAVLTAMARNEEAWPTCRTGAAKILGALGSLDQPLIRRLWSLLSVCHHPDLVAAAYFARHSEPWAEIFLEASRADPINRVIVRHLDAD